MKTLIAFLLTFVSASVFSMPRVGDVAQYEISMSGFVATQRIELTAYNPTDTFTSVQTTVFQGQSEQKTETVPTDDLVSDAAVDEIIANCTSLGGAIENLTVPAGTFNTCGLSDQGAKANIGKVPFGVVALKSADGATVRLTNFKFGK